MRPGAGQAGGVGAARPAFVLPLPAADTPPARRRARLAVAAAWLWVAVQAWVSLVQAWNARRWVTDAALRPVPAFTEYQRSSLPLLGVAALGWVCGCLWLRRVHATACTIDPWGQTAEPGIVWQCWLTPAANLVLPARLADDVTRALMRRRPRGMAEEVPLVRLWWATYLAMTGLGTAATMVSGTRAEQTGLVRMLALGQLVVTFAAASAWTRLVREVTLAHDRALPHRARTARDGA